MDAALAKLAHKVGLYEVIVTLRLLENLLLGLDQQLHIVYHFHGGSIPSRKSETKRKKGGKK